MSEPEITMYLFVNTDLGMKAGKVAAQTCHVTRQITDQIIRSGYESNKIPESYLTYMRWINDGEKKITLKATEAQLRELIKEEDSYHVIDAGRTQIAPNSLTVVGFKPSNKLSEKFKDYKLY